MSYTSVNALFEELNNADISKKLFAQINNTKYTYGQVLEDVERLQGYFQMKGLKKGDKVIISSYDEYYTSLFFLSFLKYGLTAVMLEPDAPLPLAEGIINKVQLNGFIMDESLFKDRQIEASDLFQLKIKQEKKKKGKLFSKLVKKKKAEQPFDDNTFPAILHHLKPTPVDNDVKDDDLAYILFTSGTTSFPKGVMITHGNLFTHLATLTKVYGLDSNARILNILKLYHADGINQGPVLALYNKGSWINPFKFDLSLIGDFFNAIYKYKISHLIAVPTILSFMNKYSEGYEDSFETEDFQFIISVASKLELSLWKSFEGKFNTKLANVYGLSETVNGSIFSAVGTYPRKVGTIGVPIDCKVKLIAEDGSIAAAGEIGELWLKGEHIFKGYLEDEAATNNVLVKGWLKTGDLAIQDEEGFYTITGRSKNTINTGGVNIYPEQVTEMINTHPNVLESISLGVEDELFNEKLVAAITVKPGKNLDKIELIEFLRPLLKQNQIPKSYYFFDDLPKGLSGKIQIQKVKEMIAEHSKEVQGVTHDFENQIKAAAADAFGINISNISMDDNSNSLEGWDSMAHLVFITNLEEQFNVRFSTAEMMTMNSLKSTASILNKKNLFNV